MSADPIIRRFRSVERLHRIQFEAPSDLGFRPFGLGKPVQPQGHVGTLGKIGAPQSGRGPGVQGPVIQIQQDGRRLTGFPAADNLRDLGYRSVAIQGFQQFQGLSERSGRVGFAFPRFFQSF